MGSPGVKVRSRVKVETRLNVLGTAVSEFASAFGADKDCLDTIQKGILDQQIVETIKLHYYSGKKHVGLITMHIDWARHQALVESDGGDRFEIRSDKPLVEQLDAASKEIIAHVDRIREQCRVTRIQSIYTYRDECRNDKKKLQAAREYLGHSPATEDIPETSLDEFRMLAHYEMGRLQELSIDIED